MSKRYETARKKKEYLKQGDEQNIFIYYNKTYIDTLKISLILLIQSGAETGLVLLVPGMTNNSVNVIQNGLKIIH